MSMPHDSWAWVYDEVYEKKLRQFLCKFDKADTVSR